MKPLRPLLAVLAPLALAAAALVPTEVQDTSDEPARPSVDAPAPTFRLNDHLGRPVAVGGASEEERWTVLAFFPKAATPG